MYSHLQVLEKVSPHRARVISFSGAILFLFWTPSKRTLICGCLRLFPHTSQAGCRLQVPTFFVFPTPGGFTLCLRSVHLSKTLRIHKSSARSTPNTTFPPSFLYILKLQDSHVDLISKYSQCNRPSSFPKSKLNLKSGLYSPKNSTKFVFIYF